MCSKTVGSGGWNICISWGHFGECMFVMSLSLVVKL